MKSELLLAAIGGTDDDLLLRAEGAGKHKVLWWIPCAACILLCVFLVPYFIHVMAPAHGGDLHTVHFDSAEALYEFIEALPDGAEPKRDDLLCRRFTDLPGEDKGASLAGSVGNNGEKTYTQMQLRRVCTLDGKSCQLRFYLFFDHSSDRVLIDGYEEQGRRMEPLPGVEVKYSELREPAFTHAQAIFRYQSVLYVLDLTTDEEDSEIEEWIEVLFEGR